MEENMKNTDLDELRRKRAIARKKRLAAQRRRQRILILAVCALVMVLLIGICIASLFRGRGNTDPTAPTDTNGNPITTTQSSTTAPLVPLRVVTPVEVQSTTMDTTVIFTGRGDPREALSINGQPVTMESDGTFSVELPLASGENLFTLTHWDQTLEYSIVRLNNTASFYPQKETTYCSKATVLFEVAAREGSEVVAEFRERIFKLKLCQDQLASGAPEGFKLYVGSYTLPNMSEDVNFGKITYSITYNGQTEEVTSGDIYCKESAEFLESDPSVTPDEDPYIDVGSGLIVEIVSRTAETLDGHTADDNSSPLNNYLPKGTVDYCDDKIVSNAAAGQTYRILRCGRRVYEAKRNYPAEDRDQICMVYSGTLPDHNEIGFSSLHEEDGFTILTLDAMWKAPFFLDLAPQGYTNPEARKFTIAKFTVTYVDITFCYATVFDGDVTIPENHPLFTKAEVIQNTSDITLRLHLKEMGGFYGWDAYYNEKDQLCFKFLNRTQVQKADNTYGADLSGVTVLLDVGHGGIDGGAEVVLDGKKYYEAGLNLSLSQALKQELESIGATVILNRVGNEPVTVEERLAHLKEVAPDLCIAIHQNSSESTSYNGFEVYYHHPMSMLAAKHIWQTHRQEKLYTSSALAWHVYHLARQSNCPVVLTENGYMSHAEDVKEMINPTDVQKKATMITQGVANYFLDINGLLETK